MKVYLENWTPLKKLSNTKQIVVFSQFNLTNQNINLHFIQNNVKDGEVIIEYFIEPGALTGRVRLREDVFLNVNWNEVPAGHKLIIRSREAGEVKDDESMDTVDAPTI